MLSMVSLRGLLEVRLLQSHHGDFRQHGDGFLDAGHLHGEVDLDNCRHLVERRKVSSAL
jgi:hypothetical protein